MRKRAVTEFRWPDVLETLLGGQDLTERQAADALAHIMRGEADPTQVAGFLVALRAKGESAAEIAGMARTMMEHAAPIDVSGPLVDTCGTGGDRAGTFNISTVSAVVVAAAGVTVAKHGNRAASSRCGSADLLESWGVVIDLPPADVATTIRELGIGFLFARTFHPAMRHVAPVRANLGVRTVFNVLGPLSNPAGATHQVVGVSDERLAPLMAEALGKLGKRHALVFRGVDGLDELTTTGTSKVWEVREGGDVKVWKLDPTAYGFELVAESELKGGDIPENTAIADAILAGEGGAPTEVVLLNAGAALYAADAVDDLQTGIDRAREVVASGAAEQLRDRWVARSQELRDAG